MTLRATKVRIYPDADQVPLLERQFGAVRFVYNKALHAKIHFYRTKGVSLHPVYDLKKLLAPARKSRRYALLKDFDSMALQQACINLNRAFQNFFEGRSKFPKFKRKHGHQSSYHCTGRMDFGEDWVTVPKVPGQIKAKIHRAIAGKVKSITLSRSPTGKYHASILAEDGEVAKPAPDIVRDDEVRGLDMGLTDLLVDDQGRKIANPKHLKRAQNALRKTQRSLSRKKKGSKNRNKARVKVARAHERVANARADFQHKLSRELVNENQVIIAETLKVRNMLKNSRLAKAISDAAWSSFLAKVEYKARAAGVIFARIDQWEATTKTCAPCGHKVAKMSLDVRSWSCPACGEAHDRDVNTAVNVRAIGIENLRASGLRVQACGGLRKTHHRAQRPTEAGNKVA
jgi:putative transposase